MSARLLNAAVVVMLLSWGQPWSDPSGHVEHFIEVAPRVRVEVLDWGGSGQPVLLLAGHGDTGHVFDDLAPRLTDSHHVFALTRRGSGASSQPDQGYELTTLVGDILRVLDAFHVKRVQLIGHSIAGDEMTRFARVHRDRVDKLVYLEAAYDRVEASTLEATFPKLPPFSEPTPAELSSPAAVRAMVARTVVLMPEAEIRATRVFAPDGRFLRPVTPDRILAAYAAMVEHPNYEAVTAPMLAIYAVPRTAVQLIPRYKARYERGEQDTRQALDRIFDLWRPAAKAQRDQFRNRVPSARVVEIPGAGHYLFIHQQEQIVRELRAFL